MSLRQLPDIRAFERPAGLSWDAPAEALDKWAGGPSASISDDPNTITIFDMIGEDPWSGGGFTAKRMAGALRAIGPKAVTVAINSPGGDFFEGLAIYNLLREHPAEVSVKIMGIAASAASFIAMAGDKIAMGLGSFLMIHNAWGVVLGNQNELRSVADILAKFDQAMVDIYAARTGLDAKAIGKMMDAETYIPASEAVAKGFADLISPDESTAQGGQARAELSARRRIDALLARQGVPRSERRRLMRESSAGTHVAAGHDPAPAAGIDIANAMQLIAILKS